MAAQAVVTAAEASADAEYRTALVELLWQLADDDLIIGHRASEWLGLAPHIEADVALSSLAQDEVGHATLYFGLLHELGEADPDTLAFGRPPGGFRNAVLLERPNGPGTYLDRPRFDWARSILRHYFYDVFEGLRLDQLVESSYLPLRQAAAKIRREEYYHRLHGAIWLNRLAAGGDEARRRLGQAAVELWPDVGGLFAPVSQAEHMVRLGILPGTIWGLAADWSKSVARELERTGLTWPGAWPAVELDGRCGQHSDDLGALLHTMAEVYRSDPAAAW